MIKKGDLVMVVRGTVCCGFASERIGIVYTVTSIDEFINAQCRGCGTKHRVLNARGYVSSRGDGFDVKMLRKIDPDQASDREREFDRLSRRENHPLVVGDLDTQRKIAECEK